MNKGKRSLAVDVRSPEGQELVTALITRPGPDRGVFLSNFPASGWLSDERLRARRDDLIYINIIGNPDGGRRSTTRSTRRPASPTPPGPSGRQPADEPRAAGVGHRHRADRRVGLLAAERRPHAHRASASSVRCRSPTSRSRWSPNLGYLAQAQVLGEARPPIGNDMYGAFGRDFPTADGRRVMVVAISLRQWQSLVDAVGIGEHLRRSSGRSSVDLRPKATASRPATRSPPSSPRGSPTARCPRSRDVSTATACAGAPTRRSPSCSRRTGGVRTEPGVPRHRPARHRCSARPWRLPPRSRACDRAAPRPAPLLGEHTEEILAEDLGLSVTEIGEAPRQREPWPDHDENRSVDDDRSLTRRSRSSRTPTLTAQQRSCTSGRRSAGYRRSDRRNAPTPVALDVLQSHHAVEPARVGWSSASPRRHAQRLSTAHVGGWTRHSVGIAPSRHTGRTPNAACESCTEERLDRQFARRRPRAHRPTAGNPVS